MMSLIPESVLIAALGTYPCYTVAGQPPKIFIHTILAYCKPASAGPAERGCFTAAVADPVFCSSPFAPGFGKGKPSCVFLFFGCFRHALCPLGYIYTPSAGQPLIGICPAVFNCCIKKRELKKAAGKP